MKDPNREGWSKEKLEDLTQDAKAYDARSKATVKEIYAGVLIISTSLEFPQS